MGSLMEYRPGRLLISRKNFVNLSEFWNRLDDINVVPNQTDDSCEVDGQIKVLDYHVLYLRSDMNCELLLQYRQFKGS